MSTFAGSVKIDGTEINDNVSYHVEMISLDWYAAGPKKHDSLDTVSGAPKPTRSRPSGKQPFIKVKFLHTGAQLALDIENLKARFARAGRVPTVSQAGGD